MCVTFKSLFTQILVTLSPSCSQVYAIMQTACIYFCKSGVLCEIWCGAEIGGYPCHISKIFKPLRIPQSTVSGIITKGKQLGKTASLEQSSWTPDRAGSAEAEAGGGAQSSTPFCRVISADLQTTCDLWIHSRTVHKTFCGMGFHG